MITTTKKLAEIEKVRQQIFAKTGQLYDPVSKLELEAVTGKMLRRIVARHQIEPRSIDRTDYYEAVLASDLLSLVEIARNVDSIISSEIPDFLEELGVIDENVDMKKFATFFHEQVPGTIIVSRTPAFINSLTYVIEMCPSFLKQQ